MYLSCDALVDWLNGRSRLCGRGPLRGTEKIAKIEATKCWCRDGGEKVSDSFAGSGVPLRTRGVAMPPRVSSRILKGKKSNVRLEAGCICTASGDLSY